MKWNVDKFGFNIKNFYLSKDKIKSKKDPMCFGRKYFEYTQMTEDSCYKYTKDYKILIFKNPVENWVKNMNKHLTYGEINI